MAFDVYAAVTERIIRQLEAGCIPWQKPWGGMEGGAISGTTGKPYSLLNQMILGKPVCTSLSIKSRSSAGMSARAKRLR